MIIFIISNGGLRFFFLEWGGLIIIFMFFVFVEFVIDWYVVISIYILFIIMFFCLIFLNFVNSIFERNIKGIVFYFGGFW